MGHPLTSLSDLSAIVVGGSIGGLTAAVVLRDAGLDVTVLERSATALEGRGAGIVLHEATARYLVENAGMSLDAISEGACWFRFIDRTGAVTHQEPCRYRFTAWNTLYTNLLSHLPPDRYRLGHEVADLVQSGEEVRVLMADGSSHSADLVVCADGVMSPSRRGLLPGVETKYAGYLGWRGVVRESELNPDVFGRLYEAITYTTPPLSHILAYPIPSQGGPGAERVLNYVWYRTSKKDRLSKTPSPTLAASAARCRSPPAGCRAATFRPSRKRPRLCSPLISHRWF